MKTTLTLMAAGALALTCLPFVAANAQEDMGFRMHRLHQACDHGDRRACVQFGVMIGENHDRHNEWRRTHPEWFWWER